MSTDHIPPVQAFIKPKELSVPVSKMQVPLPLVFGKWEHIADEDLNNHLSDVVAECVRRGWDVSERITVEL